MDFRRDDAVVSLLFQGRELLFKRHGRPTLSTEFTETHLGCAFRGSSSSTQRPLERLASPQRLQAENRRVQRLGCAHRIEIFS